MVEAVGTNPWIFILMAIMWFAAFMTGQAVATTWRPLGHLFLYCFLLGLTDRFLTWSLFQGELLSLSHFVVDTAVITGLALLANRITRASKMVTQYPWLYERAGLWSYRKKIAPAEQNSRAGE